MYVTSRADRKELIQSVDSMLPALYRLQVLMLSCINVLTRAWQLYPTVSVIAWGHWCSIWPLSARLCLFGLTERESEHQRNKVKNVKMYTIQPSVVKCNKRLWPIKWLTQSSSLVFHKAKLFLHFLPCWKVQWKKNIVCSHMKSSLLLGKYD